MPNTRILKVMAVLLAFLAPVLFLPENADAGGSTKQVKSTKRVGKGKGKRGGRGKFVGHGVSSSQLRTEPLAKPSGRIVARSPNLHEQVDVNIYNEDGSFNQTALAQLDQIFRCKRTGEARAVDPRLYEVLSTIYDHYGKTIEVNSGFRYQRNEGSRHFHGSAMDLSIPGVGWRDLYNYAQSLDMGGMGIGRYPRSNFVHVDYRAPGEPSYRWTDTQRNKRPDPGKQPSKMWKRSSRPNS
jgi:uncharacterized protein YcbK (DUF882 family)